MGAFCQGSNRSLLTGSVVVGAIKVVAGIVLFVATPILIDNFGTKAFGIWALTASFLGYAILLDLGIGSAVTVEIADAMRRDVLGRARTAVYVGSATYLVLGIVVLATLLVLREPVRRLLSIPSQLGDAAIFLFSAFVTAWILGRFGAVFGAVLDMRDRFVLSQGVPASLQGLTWGGALFVSMAGGGLHAASWSTIAVYTIGFAVIAWPALRELRGIEADSLRSLDLRRAVRLGSAVQVASAAEVVNFSTDRVIVASMLGIGLVAPYEIANRAASLVRVVALAPLPLIFPTLARLAPVDRQPAAQQYARILTAAAGLLTAVLIAVTVPLLDLWVGGYDSEIVRWTRGLAVAYGLHAMTGTYTVAMKAEAHFAPAARFAVAAAVLNIVGTLVLAPRFGLTGVVAGTVVGLVAATVWFYAGPVRRLGLGRQPLLSFASAGLGVALAGSAGALAADRISSSLSGAMFLGAGVSTVTFLVVAVLTRLVRRKDLVFLAR